MRRRTDQIQFGVSVATLVALFGILYTIYRNSYQDVVRNIERFQEQVARVIEKQNDRIERLERRR